MPKTLLRPTQRIKRVAGEQQLIIRQLDEAQAGAGKSSYPFCLSPRVLKLGTAGGDTTRRS